MRRIVSIWLPDWPIERLARATPPGALRDALGDGPLALVVSGTRGLTIHALNGAARREGVRPGVALADARAALPHLASRPAEPARDRAALVALARWAGRYGPQRHADGADGLWVDTTGVAHLHGGEPRLAGDIYRRLAGLGFTARVAIAGTHGAAHALARFAATAGRPVLTVAAGDESRALAALPVAALRLPPDTVLLARRLGLKRIGDLYGMPRTSLARRFRSDAIAATLVGRLDAALGRAPEPRAALSEPPVLSVEKSFPEPLPTSEALMHATAELTHALAARLDDQALGLRRARLLLWRTDASTSVVEIGTAAPVRDPAHVMSLIAGRLEAIDAGFGIDLMRIDAIAVESLGAQQEDFRESTLKGAPGFGGAGAGSRHLALARLTDRLANRLGEGSVAVMLPAASHLPEYASRRYDVMALRRARRDGALPDRARLDAAHTRGSRPALLLERPEEITVMAEVPDGPPLRFTWRRVEHRVAAAEGPERIGAEWWRHLAASRSGEAAATTDDDARAGSLGELQPPPSPVRPRDYYAVEDLAGARYWVFREGLHGREDEEGVPHWFLHGVFA